MRSRVLILSLLLALVPTVLPAAPAGAAYPGDNGPIVFARADGSLGVLPRGGQPFQIVNPIVGTVAQLLDPVVSPDGRMIAFVYAGAANTEIWTVDLTDGQFFRLTAVDEIGLAQSPTWTPDASAVLFTAIDTRDQDAKLWTVPPRQAAPQALVPLPTAEIAMSPAGDAIAFWDEVGDRIRLLELATGRVVTIFTTDIAGIIGGQSPLPTRPDGQPFQNVLEMSFAPDARSLLFNCSTPLETPSGPTARQGQICEVATDGSGTRIALVLPDQLATGAAFTPRGDAIVFSAFPPSGPSGPGGVPRIFIRERTAPVDAPGIQLTVEDGNFIADTMPDVGPALGTTPPPPGTIGPTLPPGGGPGDPGGGGPGGPGPGGPGPGGPGPGPGDPGGDPGGDPPPAPSTSGPSGGQGAAAFAADPAATPAIGSASPVATALDIARARFPDGSPPPRWAVLSRDDDFPDSLAGTALTGDGPMLLTGRDALDPAVGAELARTLPPGARVYLLGGEAALAPAVEAAVLALGLEPARLAGPERISTALAVADEVRRRYPDAPATALLARAGGPPDNPTAGWADSVSAGSYAAARAVPVLLTDTAALDGRVGQWLTADGVQRTALLGGDAALAAGMESQVPGGIRVAGDDRTATAAAVARILWESPAAGSRAYVLVNGAMPQGWAFGLVAAGLGADASAPTVLVGDVVSPAVRELVAECEVKAVRTLAVGDLSVISQQVRDEVEAQDGRPCQTSPF